MPEILLLANKKWEKEMKRREMVAFFHVLKDMMNLNQLDNRYSKEDIFMAIGSSPGRALHIKKCIDEYISDEQISPKLEKFYDEFVEWKRKNGREEIL